jgi:hypothetical protein
VSTYSFKASEGYDPARSRVSDEKMQQWKTTRITGNLIEVPGIGPQAVKLLANSDQEGECVTNTYQLFGKYLMLKGPNVDPIEHAEKMWYWLKNRGINSCRSGIVRSIAEKAATFFPELYDPNAYADSDDENDRDNNN